MVPLRRARPARAAGGVDVKYQPIAARTTRRSPGIGIDGGVSQSNREVAVDQDEERAGRRGLGVRTSFEPKLRSGNHPRRVEDGVLHRVTVSTG